MQRASAVAGLVLIGLAATIFTGWSPWSWAWPGSADEQREQFHADIRTVVLDTGAADVTIRTRDQTRTSLTTRVDAWAWTRPDATHRRDGETLVLTGCGSGCAVDYEVVVPRGTTVEGHTGSGTVTAVGVTASTRLHRRRAPKAPFASRNEAKGTFAAVRVSRRFPSRQCGQRASGAGPGTREEARPLRWQER